MRRDGSGAPTNIARDAGKKALTNFKHQNIEGNSIRFAKMFEM